MNEQDTMISPAPAMDVEAILAMIPADYRAAGRQYLASIAEATTDEERARLQQATVDATLKVAKERGWCSVAEGALTRAFGEPEGGTWRASDGFDRQGYDADGYSREGFNTAGYDRDGFSPVGLNRQGYDRDGYNRDGFDADGLNREGFDRHGYNRDGLDPDGRSKYRFDLEGWDSEGFNREGFNREGWNRQGFNVNGYNRDGVDTQGRSMFRFDLNGVAADGYNRYDQDYDGTLRVSNVAAGRPPRVSHDHPLHGEYLAWREAQRRR